MMTKKDYIKIADILKQFKEAKDNGVRDEVLFLVDEFSYWLEDNNPNFNEKKFREAVL